MQKNTILIQQTMVKPNILYKYLQMQNITLSGKKKQRKSCFNFLIPIFLIYLFKKKKKRDYKDQYFPLFSHFEENTPLLQNDV